MLVVTAKYISWGFVLLPVWLMMKVIKKCELYMWVFVSMQQLLQYRCFIFLFICVVIKGRFIDLS